MLNENFLKWANFSSASLVSMSGSSVSTSQMGGGIAGYVNNVSAYYSNNASGSYVDVGFGNTPESQSDNKLAISNAVDSPALTFISNGFVANGTYPYLRNLTTTYVNNSGNDVTITEIGYVQKGGQANNAGYNALMSREVLDTPILVPSGQQVSITISFEL